ncbi:MAG: hypothetical protein HY075_03615 [Deltaproteobacteria bacterium]|nr:hypothetical protein [Deltaproteobacteria bacterium]
MTGPVQFKILEETAAKPLTYTGKELRPHWGLEKTGVYGSLLTAFIGPCEVPTAHGRVFRYDSRSRRFVSAALHGLGRAYPA